MTTLDEAPPIRVAVAGCGQVVEKHHLSAIGRAPGLALAALCDPSAERRRWAGSALPDMPVRETLQQALDSDRPDAVLVAAPPNRHRELAEAALAAGCHVLVEKPVGAGLADALAIEAAARAAGRQVWAGFVRRFRPPYRRLRAAAAAAPDDIRGVSVHMRWSPTAWGSVDPAAHGLGDGHDILGDVASHIADLVPWLLASPVTAVRVESTQDLGDGRRSLDFRLRLANGVVAACRADQAPGYRERIAVRKTNRVLLAHAYGSVRAPVPLPSLFVEPFCRLRGTAHLLRHRLGGTPNVTQQSFDTMWASFAAALRGDGTLDAPDGRSAVRCQQVLAACRVSQPGGGWTEVDLKEDVA